ncbi:hypothetical protein C5B90_06330 [Haloferax sp. Atlit-12N]|uniref:hypothetical protein n=1 Tax=Haloferax sp. Atlit-12N TaxID=2077203 RepID=UPI000E26D238|nr:hypothetical protein [Haloferax sp. Atlit-12N]RDZ65960.1 hypothetical protein C5B90_06330 [Haloferax sp. Atlit-12N]
MSEAKVIEDDDGELLVQMPYAEGCRGYCIGFSYAGLLLVSVSSLMFLTDAPVFWLRAARFGYMAGISIALVAFVAGYTVPCRFYELMEDEPDV